jgi:hypothetical protein
MSENKFLLKKNKIIIFFKGLELNNMRVTRPEKKKKNRVVVRHLL